MNASNTLKKLGIEQTFNYIYKDPDKHMPKMMDWADKFADGEFISQRKIIREAITDPEHPYYSYIRRLFKEVDPNVTKTLAVNLFINASLVGWKKEEELRKKYNCNIPWAILLDPTSACNLHCTGCWAAEYGHKLNLTYDEIDDIICQGKELGVYLYIYTGGEPLVRKKDLIRICEKHSDCVFLCFTNSTLIDEEFADEMLRVGNFVPAISLEGFEEATDGRRGTGVYQKVRKAMELLRRKKLIYGISCCYTSANYDSITSEEFYDTLIEMGAYFVWYFHYMPVGNDAVPELMPTPQQRTGVYEKIRRYRATKPLFALDFQNDAEYVEAKEHNLSDEEIEAIGAGDQGMMFGYATNETKTYMPYPIELAHKLALQLTKVRKEGILPYLRPDGKTQVTVEYDEKDKPFRLDAVVLSTQHDPDITQGQIQLDIKKYVFDEILPGGMVDENTKFYINPTGRFVIGGPHGDSGLTGRKIIVDTYGGYARHGGGAFSGKDCTKVDRSASYAARYAAKNIVASGLAEKCEVQLSYAIGVAQPTSIMVDTFGTGKLSDERITEIVRENFDFRPAGIIKELTLRRPIYRQTAAYGHFGREDLDLPWERLDKVNELKKYL